MNMKELVIAGVRSIFLEKIDVRTLHFFQKRAQKSCLFAKNS